MENSQRAYFIQDLTWLDSTRIQYTKLDNHLPVMQATSESKGWVGRVFQWCVTATITITVYLEFVKEVKPLSVGRLMMKSKVTQNSIKQQVKCQAKWLLLVCMQGSLKRRLLQFPSPLFCFQLFRFPLQTAATTTSITTTYCSAQPLDSSKCPPDEKILSLTCPSIPISQTTCWRTLGVLETPSPAK